MLIGTESTLRTMLIKHKVVSRECGPQLVELRGVYLTHFQPIVGKFHFSVYSCSDTLCHAHTSLHACAHTHARTYTHMHTQEVCVRSYNSQLARLHVEHHFYLLMHSVPDSATMTADAPVSSEWGQPGPQAIVVPYNRDFLIMMTLLVTPVSSEWNSQGRRPS